MWGGAGIDEGQRAAREVGSGALVRVSVSSVQARTRKHRARQEEGYCTKGQLVLVAGAVFLAHVRRHAQLFGNVRIPLEADNELGVSDAGRQQQLPQVSLQTQLLAHF